LPHPAGRPANKEDVMIFGETSQATGQLHPAAQVALIVCGFVALVAIVWINHRGYRR
jgi:hypothetical protein